jgi:activating signal cointegrator 1
MILLWRPVLVLFLALFLVVPRGLSYTRSMKALTLTQPWASLVASGAKRIETRSWRTPYRGSLWIHAAKEYPTWAKKLCEDRMFAMEIGSEVLPTGVVLAECRLISCIPTRELQQNRVIEVDYLAGCDDFYMSDSERLFGDYTAGRWAWLLADMKLLKNPVPAKGARGLWDWSPPATGNDGKQVDATTLGGVAKEK